MAKGKQNEAARKIVFDGEDIKAAMDAAMKGSASPDHQAIIAWYSYYTEARMDVAVAMIQEKGLYDEWISRFKEQWSKKGMDPVVNPKEA